jgi:ATP-dependent DNA helicase RecQ
MAGCNWPGCARDVARRDGDGHGPAAHASKSVRRDRGTTPNPSGDPLFEALRALRRDLAAEAKVPPYVIFNDATLRQMASDRPGSMQEMAQISGVGAKAGCLWRRFPAGRARIWMN